LPKILVIDDDESYRAYLSALLARNGYEVCSLRNGRALAETITAEPFDAVITDLFMPDIDGIEILRTVRQVAPSVPVICLTGRGPATLAHDVCKRAMLMLGAAAVLMKPIDGEVLLDALSDARERRRRAGAIS
jgi:DNA-binding NtrC family response regulator